HDGRPAQSGADERAARGVGDSAQSILHRTARRSARADSVYGAVPLALPGRARSLAGTALGKVQSVELAIADLPLASPGARRAGMATNNYAHPEALVETDWLAKHLTDNGVRIVESNEDILLYDTGHIPGAVHIDWRTDLQDPVIRDYISPDKFAELCSKNGITPETTCIFYGDKANWSACYALWAFRLFGHDKVKILNGGRDKWKAEGRTMTREKSAYPRTNYPVPKKRFDKEIRAFFEEALAQSKSQKPLIDVR